MLDLATRNRRTAIRRELAEIKRAEKSARPARPKAERKVVGHVNLKADRASTKEPLYLAYVRRLPCAVGPVGCVGPVEAAHVRFGRPGEPPTGLQRKPPDCRAVPLCSGHHRTNPDAQHAGSERRFWERRGIDPHALADAHYATYRAEGAKANG